MTGRNKKSQRAKIDDSLDDGLDPAVIRSIIGNIPPNPITGQVEMGDIVKYMANNPEQMEIAMSQTAGLSRRQTLDLSAYDFASLASTIKHESFWVIQLENMGLVDAAGISVEPAQASTAKGVRPTFMIYCYDDQGGYRVTQDCIGLPDAKTLLQSIQCAIAKPYPPLKPCLPWFLMISRKFLPLVPDIRPFLDTLPAPFHWRLETADESDTVDEGIYTLNKRGFKVYLELAAQQKAEGNQAFAKKDRSRAMKGYNAAIDNLLDALSQNPDDDETQHSKKQLAICYANRAATHLLDGEGIDAKAALADAREAEATDPDYAKAYFRQAKAHEVLGQLSEAQDAMIRALRRPKLENENNLVDRLIELQTDGKGLSDDETTFRNWMLDILNNKASSERMKNLSGEWKRRCDRRLAKWNK